MDTDFPHSTSRLLGHPLHPGLILVPVPIACFVGTLITDTVYLFTVDILWATMSAWLLTAGLVMSAFAAIASLIDFLRERRISALAGAWIHGLGAGVAIGLSILNLFVHSRDGYTAVVPLGLTLSALVVAVVVATVWLGWDMVFQRRVGVLPADAA